jgi:hypothetical protein
MDVCCCELRKVFADGLRDCVREEAWSLRAVSSFNLYLSISLKTEKF